MFLTASVSWLFATLDTQKQDPIPSFSEGDSITQPKTVEIKQSEEETESHEQIETADSSESVASPFSFQVNIIQEEAPVKAERKVFYAIEHSIMRETFAELEKRKIKICKKPRRWKIQNETYNLSQQKRIDTRSRSKKNRLRLRRRPQNRESRDQYDTRNRLHYANAF